MLDLDDEKMRVSNYGSRYHACKAAVARSRELKVKVENGMDAKIKFVSTCPILLLRALRTQKSWFSFR